MIKFYAIGLIIGFLALLAWVILRTLAVNVPAWSSIDPEHRFGVPGRRVVAALMGFGMAGMSSSFAPWPLPATIATALAGAAASAWYAGWPTGDRSGKVS